MMHFAGKSIHEVASDYRVQAAVNRINRPREAEKLVSTLSVKLAVAEHDLALIQREIDKDSK